MTKKADFQITFEKLRAILEPYASKLVLTVNTDKEYMLDVDHVMKNKHRLFFAGVRKGKAYVSFHLMPVYAFSDLKENISPKLRRRMQGKSCFNFSSPDEGLFKELAKLTKLGFSKFTSKKFYQQF